MPRNRNAANSLSSRLINSIMPRVTPSCAGDDCATGRCCSHGRSHGHSVAGWLARDVSEPGPSTTILYVTTTLSQSITLRRNTFNSGHQLTRSYGDASNCHPQLRGCSSRCEVADHISTRTSNAAADGRIVALPPALADPTPTRTFWSATGLGTFTPHLNDGLRSQRP